LKTDKGKVKFQQKDTFLKVAKMTETKVISNLHNEWEKGKRGA
jgi:hypothetical protein